MSSSGERPRASRPNPRPSPRIRSVAADEHQPPPDRPRAPRVAPPSSAPRPRAPEPRAPEPRAPEPRAPGPGAAEPTTAPRPGTPRPRAERGALAPDPRSFRVPAPGSSPTVAPPAPPAPPARPAAPRLPQPPEEGGVPEAPPARRRLRWKRIVGAVAAVLVLLMAFSGWYVYRTYRKLERIEVGAVLSPGGGGGTNYLIVGTDTREGLDAGMENADVVIGGGVSGSRSDTVVMLRTGGDGNLMLPIPRDLFVPIAGTGDSNRINTAIQGGPERLIQTVQQGLGLPVHHYVEIDFAGFLDLVDALGGVDIEFDAPAFDEKSGLFIDAAGVQHLDQNQALAYVRSRTYTRVIGGRNEVDGRGDLGRIERQQIFLRAVMSQAGAARNPFTVARIGNAIASNLRVDDEIGFFESIGLARKLAGLNPETVEIPTNPIRTSGGAAVLELEQPGADEALGRFR